MSDLDRVTVDVLLKPSLAILGAAAEGAVAVRVPAPVGKCADL